MSHLFYGDNLAVMREEIDDASVDLVYLDPPFNSNAGYNVLFKSANGAGADASIEAFDDTYLPHSGEYTERYSLIDDVTGRRFQATSLLNPAKDRPNLTYEFGGHTRVWRWTRDRMQAAADDGLVYFPPNGGAPREKRFLDEQEGVPISDVWTDIPPLNSQAQERLGYPTQKPRALLERIIAASSNPGDVVLDPFCGCGTAVDAAQKLGRRWIGIDVTHIAIGMIENRMREGYPGIQFETIGVPKDLASAERLATDDPHQFQQWVSWQVGGYPRDKKGGDRGIDGWFNYLAESGRIESGVISVKAGGTVNPNMVRDLGSVMERDRFRFGLFVLKSLPTRGMRDEAASHPMIETAFGRFPALQFVTLAELMHGHRPWLPPLVSSVRKATRVEMRASHQTGAQGNLI